VAVSATIDRAIATSAKDFQRLVWPLFADKLGGGTLVPVESVTDSRFTKLLDTEAGIDAWQLVGSGGLRGLASRVQWGPTNWRSWTIRTRRPSGRPTERDKLINADISLLHPTYHIQAYLAAVGGPVLGAACIRTADLARLLLNGKHGSERPNPVDGAWFVPVWWDDAQAEYMETWEVAA
jgi:hypothetical protein